MLSQLLKRSKKNQPKQEPVQEMELPDTRVFIQRWSGARKLLNAGQVLEVDAGAGIYRVGDVTVNLAAATCECCAPSKPRGFRPACQHLNAAFLYADAAQTAVEDVETFLDLQG